MPDNNQFPSISGNMYLNIMDCDGLGGEGLVGGCFEG